MPIFTLQIYRMEETQSKEEEFPIKKIELKEGVLYRFKHPCGCEFQWLEEDLHEAFHDLVEKSELERQAINN